MNVFKIILLLFFAGTAWLFAQDAYINDFRVNDDFTTKTQGGSLIGVDSTGNFVIAWMDRRNSATDMWSQVYCQVFDKWSNRIGNNFRIGQDTSWLFGLAVLPDGRFACFWKSTFNNASSELYFERFDRLGNPLQIPIRVVDSVYSSVALRAGGLACDSSGNFIASWTRLVGSSYVIVYCQRFDSSGIKIGNPIIANDVINGVGASDAKITVNANGDFVCCWVDDRNNTTGIKNDIYMQRYNSNGVRIGNNTKVNDDNDSTIEQSLPSIGGDGKGRFVIAWYDERAFLNEPHIYYQVYDSTGNSVGPNKKADRSSGMPAFPVVGAGKDGKFFIGWEDDWYAGRYQYYGRRYSRVSDTVGNIFMIPEFSPSGSRQVPDDIKIMGDRIYSCWEDNRNGNFDIYCNVRSFQNPDSVIIGIEPITIGSPNKFRFYPAYPNPFNPVTTIKYDLPKDDFVTVRIYDITGKVVSTGLNSFQKKGTHEITIHGEKFSSGIYFIQLFTESGNKAVQKLILIK